MLCSLVPHSKSAMEWFSKEESKNQIIEYIDDFPKSDIEKFYLGKPLINCIASKCRKKTMKLTELKIT